MKALKYILGVVLLSSTVSCKKYVDIENPKDQLVSSSVFVSDATATAAMVGVYSDMNAYNYQFANVLTTFMGAMSADEFAYAAAFASFDEFKNNAITPGNTYVGILWSQPYDFIYRSNAIIKGVTASTTLSAATKNQLLGEARFVRAFCHFYLTNMFGDVPLVLTDDVPTNSSLPRTPKADVYTAVIADLVEAKKLLVNAYPGNQERTRPNKAAATLLLARVYLYAGNNAQAETEATEVITNSSYSLLKNPDQTNAASMSKAFLKNSNEAIWQLQVVNTLGGRNTWEGNLMVPATSPLYRITTGPNGLASAFEPGDKRFTNWVGTYNTTAVPPVTYYYPFKYKVRVGASGAAATEYSMVLRFAEAYLIRAEARIQQSKLSDGKDDLNVIRDRAGLTGLGTPVSIAAGMAMVEQERRVELFAEWGHRWFDLKRWKSVTGVAGKSRADDVLPLTKTGWKPTAVLFPIPTEVIRTNPNIGGQNPGYN